MGFPAAPTPGRKLGAARRLTASFGVAQMLDGESYEDMLGRADAALYQAKAAGRDCVRVAGAQAGAVAPPADDPVARRFRDARAGLAYSR